MLPAPLRFLPLTLLAGGTSTFSATPDFYRDIQPIFQAHCLHCHGPDEQNGGLRYDLRGHALAQADSGHHAIVPGKPEQSTLLQRITSAHKDEQMPPKGPRLSTTDVATLTAWIQAGADWPEDVNFAAEPKPTSNHWAFQPLSHPAPPTVKDPTWPRNPIDFFIQAKREAAGLSPAPDADSLTLQRRLHYDLTGLPPDRPHRSYKTYPSHEELVDSLLATPAYGERWARHWLDWVRYADTAGDNSDFPIPQAYLYRNYVIESLNADLPYNRFLTEQLAGDLLPATSQQEKNRLTIATGYLAMARRFGSLVERYPQHLTIEDTLDNLGRTVMGLTISCARCHDHKFDPISTRDYYGLYGIFASTRYPFPGIELFQTQRDLVPLIPESEATAKLKPFQKETQRLTADLEKKLADCEIKALENAQRERTASLAEQRKMKAELDGMLITARKAGEALAKHLKTTPVIPAAYAVQDARPSNARIQLKGEPDRPGAEVPRKFPDVLGGHTLPAEIASQSSGRLQLAQWLTDPQNPLTARVIVNRVWQRHFGKGLVPSTSDFGLRGEAPTHPELLDWLASDFIRHGWSLKHLHRRILTSRTWQMASIDNEENLASDPGNTHYWKFNRQRLDAESLRDTLLLISGQLDPTPQTQPYPIPPTKDWKYTQHHPFKDDYPSNKRSLYQMTKRLTAQPYMQTFDGPDPNACTATRDSSVTALQALHFLNDDTLHTTAERIVKNLLQTTRTPTQQITDLHQNLFRRPPTPEEQTLLLTHLQTLQQNTPNDLTAYTSLTRALLRTNEFLYLD
jgi:hypothetical protein